MTSQGQTVLANVQTTASESLRMRGVWLTLRVVNADLGQNDTVTVFVAEAVQTGNGNESLSGPSEDIDQYLTIIDCDSLTGQECADLQQCYTSYANCMINAATVYNDAVEDCNSWETTIIGVGAGACTGTGLGLGIGTALPGPGTCVGGALGMVIGGIVGGIGAYWYCMDDASDTYYTDAAICVNNLEACVQQWVLTHSD